MSTDSWGGGSDQDPKLRKKEQQWKNRWSKSDEEGEPVKEHRSRASSDGWGSTKKKFTLHGVTWTQLIVMAAVFAVLIFACIAIKPRHSNWNQVSVPVRF